MSERIFISHNSSNMSEEEKAIYNALLTRLDKEGFARDGQPGRRGKLLIDENNLPGHPWRKRVNEWLHEAEHAIIFCTQEWTHDVPILCMRDWLFTEATVLSHRHQVGSLPGLLLVVCCGIPFKKHLFSRLDSLHLREIQVLEIASDRDDLNLQKAVDAVVAACSGRACGTPRRSSELHGDLELLADWLQQFAPDQVAPLGNPARSQEAVLQAMRNLGVDPTARTCKDIKREHYMALALRLVRGPMAAPHDFVQLQYPYHAEHVARWDELTRFNGKRHVGHIGENLVDKLATTWAGILKASLLGHDILRCRQVFHVRVLLSRQHSAEHEPSPEEVERLRSQFYRRYKAPRKLLESLLSAAGWIWLGADSAPTARHVAEQCRYIRNELRERGTIIQVPADVYTSAALIKLMTEVGGRIRPDKSALESPLVIVDDRRFFCDGDDPDPEKIEEFLAECDKLVEQDEDWAYSRVFLFIVSHGKAPVDSWRREWPQYEVPVEAWQAAIGLEAVRQDTYPVAS
jgi:hypothetical protein